MDLLLVVLLGLLVMVALVVVLATANPWLPVSQTVTVPNAGPERLEDPMFLLLSNVPGAEVHRPRPASFALLVRRSPGWIWLPLVLTFPLGLLFLMVKQTGSLDVSLTATGGDTDVRMVGRTPKSVVKTLAKALGSLGA